MATTASEGNESTQFDSKNAGDLLQKLDDLLEHYLNALDNYQKARERLSADLAAGNISLAQANFSSITGRRHGQDHYDERMQAQRVVFISCPQGDEEALYTFGINEIPESERADVDEEETEKEAKSKPKARNPLNWFGVLVPQPLRSAQASFTSAVQSSIPDVLNVQQRLRCLEIEIGRTRKSLKKLEKV